MLNSLDFVTILWHNVKKTPLAKLVKGAVYKLQYPEDDRNEKIVINAITADNELVQNGVCNVNIHVPELLNGLPDTARMQVLAALGCKYLQSSYNPHYTFFMRDQQVIPFPETKEWVINFKIHIKSHYQIT